MKLALVGPTTKLSRCGRRKRRWVDKQREVADTEQKRRLTGEKEEKRAVKDLAAGEWRTGDRKSRLAAECRGRPSV
jgi:hypothetical protein